MGGGFVVNEMGAVQTKENSMRGGFVVVYVVNEMGVIQTKEKRRASAASALTPAAVLSIANTAPVPPAAPPYAAVELADSAKRDGDVVADTAATGGVDAVLEGFLGSEGGGGGGEDERDRSGHEVEVAGEDEGGRSVSSEEGKEAEVEAVPGGKRERKAKVRPLYRRRPGQLVCTFFVQSGYCKFGADCKFNHPPNRRGRKEKCKKQHDALQVAEKEKDVSQQGVALAEYEKVDEMIGNSKERDKRIKYPQRPDATDCSFYMKTGACKFGSACRFNHPSERKNNKANVEKESVPFQDVKEKFKDKPPKSFGQKEKDVKGEASPKSFGQMRKDVKEKLKEAPFKSFGQKEKDVKEKLKGTLPKSFGQKGKDVKFKEALPKSSVQKEKSYTTPGSRNISKQSNHQGVKESSSVAMNFLNLPIRPGAKECSHYMREGSCKFGINCKHHHPEPTATNASDLPSEYKDGQSTQQFGFGVSPLPGTPWHASTSYTKAMHLPYGLYPNPEWNRYQVPMLQPEMHTRNTSASPVNHADNKANILLHQQAHIEYPQRPGQPECHYFKKTGVCKIGSACKFHHPKDQLGINANSNSEPKQICEFTHQL